MAISVRCRLRRPADDRCGFSGARQRRSATVDSIRAETAESRRNLRTGRPGARSRGRGRADRALRTLFARGRYRKLEERASLLIHSLEDLGGLQLIALVPILCAIFMPHLASRIFYSSLLFPDYRTRKTMYSKHIANARAINMMNVYKA